ncbi:PilZ domain-containing protein [Vibrio sp. 99-8-1]|uniref:PilZ domain-containing protein n=1 Tax=Vibrio sp. 99-8-1 TaxID=2607602 RepID=UPI001493D760|nr:PilZ domain-containing protein [Vibrio sp. 99-8-1]NOI64848.1 PilZ domain-containing protein [Vibrio sp. 99-8-1]
MQQSELLSLVEKLIPVYGAPDFDLVLGQLTEDAPPSAKVIAKMELNRLMAPCTKSIDLRGRVQGECREYKLDGRIHWLDDVAINSYHKKIKRFGGYTEGVYEAMVNTRNNFRVMHQNEKAAHHPNSDAPESPFAVETIKLGMILHRQEKRLKLSTQVTIELPDGHLIHATSVDLSNSGVKLKVPTAFEYSLGAVIQAHFTELEQETDIAELNNRIDYRVIGIDECQENESIRWLRALRLTDTDVIARAIEVSLDSSSKKASHDNQDKILQARTHGYEHTYIKHTPNLPLLFCGSELKYALLNNHNHDTWRYWHDERFQQGFGALFSPQRMSELAKSGVRNSSNVIYAFTHEHQGKTLHYSMMLPEATRQERQLFWHTAARRCSWKVYRIHMFELNYEEKAKFANYGEGIDLEKNPITHLGVLQEISNASSKRDYQLTAKPDLDTSVLNKFRHPRKITGNPKGIYFDAISRRKEQRFLFQSPINFESEGNAVISGTTINFSSQGLFVKLNTPLISKIGNLAKISFKELQFYDEKAPLTQVPYNIVCISPDGLNIHLAVEDSSKTSRTIHFLKKLISHNKNKLNAIDELLPSEEMLNIIYESILTRLVSTPYYVSKVDKILQPIAIGVNYPLAPYLKLFQDQTKKNHFSLESVFKKRSARLLKDPLRPITPLNITYNDIYIAVIKNQFGEVETIHTKLEGEFANLQERIRFIKKSKQLGEFYSLRLSGIPVENSITKILSKKLSKLASGSFHQTKSLEKEFASIIGFGEFIDVSEEVLIRLELT